MFSWLNRFMNLREEDARELFPDLQLPPVPA
jgi:hypothetical protein